MRTVVCAEIECKNGYIDEWTRLIEGRTLALRNQGNRLRDLGTSRKPTSTSIPPPKYGSRYEQSTNTYMYKLSNYTYAVKLSISHRPPRPLLLIPAQSLRRIHRLLIRIHLLLLALLAILFTLLRWV